jgi:hypothetical protein
MAKNAALGLLLESNMIREQIEIRKAHGINCQMLEMIDKPAPAGFRAAES